MIKQYLERDLQMSKMFFKRSAVNEDIIEENDNEASKVRSEK